MGLKDQVQLLLQRVTELEEQIKVLQNELYGQGEVPIPVNTQVVGANRLR